MDRQAKLRIKFKILSSNFERLSLWEGDQQIS